jgi:hypothetical protein
MFGDAGSISELTAKFATERGIPLGEPIEVVVVVTNNPVASINVAE